MTEAYAAQANNVHRRAIEFQANSAELLGVKCLGTLERSKRSAHGLA